MTAEPIARRIPKDAQREFLASIAPSRGAKYSAKLHRWCAEFFDFPRFVERPLAFVSSMHPFDPDDPPTKADVGPMEYTDRRRIIIGSYDHDDDSWFYGGCPSEICNPNLNKSAVQSAAYSLGHGLRHWVDVTDWFWREYRNYGKCAVLGDIGHDWIQINKNARKCRHCLRHERRKVVTVRRWDRVERWETPNE